MSRLEELHGQYAGAVSAYARRRSDGQTAEEVCAEVWEIVWRRLGDVPQDDALPWLLGVARRVLANHRRSARRLGALRLRLFAMAAPADHESQAPALPADPLLGRALARLRPADREALLLIAWDHLEPKEAAAVLGVRPGTFAVRFHRARRRLADAIALEEPADASLPSIPAVEEAKA